VHSVAVLGAINRWVQGNLISGNGRNGVRSWGAAAWVMGNYIGTNAAGDAAVPNGGDGVQVEEAYVEVGSNDRPTASVPVIDPAGTTRNIISGNRGHGIHSIRATAGTVINNYVGTDATGTRALGNGGDGMLFEGGRMPVVGWGFRRPPTDLGNVVSANRGNGITVLGANGDRVSGINSCRIGTDPSGSTTNAALGNAGHGIAVINSSDIVIGGMEHDSRRQQNTIAFNGGSGVFVQGDHPTTPREPAKAEILRNSIFSNGRLGIDLSSPRDPADGVTPNDRQDGDRGPNNLINYPVLTAATPFFRATQVPLTMQVEPNRTFVIQFYATVAPDPSGYGEGRSYVASVTLSADGDGNIRATATIPGVRPGMYLTATATASGQTSEFSNAVRVGGNLTSRRAPYPTVEAPLCGAASATPALHSAWANLTEPLTGRPGVRRQNRSEPTGID
jgi:hypothetical protein